jgi:hypothetical protein
MRSRTIFILLAPTLIGLAALGSSVLAAGGSKPQLVNLTAATFTSADETTHNNNANSVCGSFRMAHPPGENKGDLNAKTGSFLTNARLPQGATVKRLTVYANDNSDQDVHVYLVRKRILGGLTPQFKGYSVIGKVDSSGAVLNTMRRFDDTAITKPVVDNSQFDYYVEMVVCDAIEPFDVQIAYTN